jgi:molybdopterin biosynthesis enzyme
MDSDTPQRIAKLTPLADVLARIDALVKPVAERERAPVATAGRVLARDVVLPRHPRVPLALRDGWAVSAEATADASAYAPVPLTDAARIDVGQPLPAGTDAIAPIDVVIHRHGRAEIVAPVGSGEGVLPAGGDADGHSAVLRAGHRLTGLQAAALAAAGAASVSVREPVVRLARTREGVDVVLDAAVDLIADELAVAGACVKRDAATLEDALTDETADAVFAVGGTGSGRHDTAVTTLARLGRLEVHGIALTPGESAAFGLIGSRPILLLPGRLDAAFAVWRVIGRRVLARLAGDDEERAVEKVRLGRKLSSPLGLAELVPVRLRDGTAEPIASGYVPISALLAADGWVLVPADSEGYPPGAEVVLISSP